MRLPCPSPDELSHLSSGRLPKVDRERLKEHLDECPTCQRVLQEVRSKLGASTADGAVSPSLPPTLAADAPASPRERDLTTEQGGLSETADGWTRPLDPRLHPTTDLGPRGRRVSSTVKEQQPRVAGYEIRAELGRGGMGVVYRARQTSLKRDVALKMILAGSHADAQQRARFQAEAEAVAQLQHPNIVQVYEVGQQDGLPYFSLEFVAGKSLEEARAGVPQVPRRSAELVETLARAMHYAHQRGIVHRDLKPANILLTEEGAPKIGDFGLVRRLDDESLQTATGIIVGTASYMAPEQSRGEKVGPAADIYALGAILYCLLTGHPPFLGATLTDTILQLQNDEAVPPSRSQPKTPQDIETICLKCLEKDPRKRYETAEELAEDLRRFLADEPIKARPVGKAERVWRWCRRNPRIALPSGLAAALVVCLALGGWAAVYHINLARVAAMAAAERETTAKQRAEEAAELESHTANLAVDSLMVVVRDVQSELYRVPNTAETRKKLLETAIISLDGISKEGHESSFIRATAHRQRGDIYFDQADQRASNARRTYLERSLQHYSLAHDAVKEAAANFDYAERPWEPLANLARANDAIALAKLKLGESVAAQKHFQHAHDQRKRWLELLEADPRSEQMPEAWSIRKERAEQAIAKSLLHLGKAYSVEHPKKALAYYEQAQKQREAFLKNHPKPQLPENRADWPDVNWQFHAWTTAQRELGGVIRDTGVMKRKLGQTRQAIACLSDALQKWNEVLEIFDEQPGFQGEYVLRGNMALAHSDLADTYLLSQDYAAAEQQYQKALEIFEDYSNDGRFRRSRWRAHYGLATAYLKTNTQATSEHFALALEMSTNPVDQMLSLARCGQHAAAADIAGQLLQSKLASNLYHAACGYGLCAWAVTYGKHEGELTDEEKQLHDTYAAQAVDCLAKAIDRGFRAWTEAQQNPELDAIRARDDFQQTLARLAATQSL